MHTSYVERAAGGSVVGAATLTDQPLRLLITRAGLLAQQQYGKGAGVSSSQVRPHAVVKAVERLKASSHYFRGGDPVAPVV